MSGTDNLPERLRELLDDESDRYAFALVEEAADEIERLEQWKTEATKALTHWDHVAEPVVAGNAKYLGWYKWDAVAVDLNRLQARIDQLEAELKAQAFMSANRQPRPGDTHVETLMRVAIWEEFRP